MKKLFFVLLIVIISFSIIKADETIYNINEEYVYETSDYEFKCSFDINHNINLTILNSNKDFSCEFQVDFLDKNNKLIYTNHYDIDALKDEKDYLLLGIENDKKNIVSKYKIESNCHEYNDETVIIDTNNDLSEFSISKRQVITIFIIFVLFDLLTIIFIVFILKTLFRKINRNKAK